MKIAEAAELVGVETHVLRHWEDVGVLRPGRTASGHRDYDANTVDQARMIRVAQRAGFTLAEIRELASLGSDGRRTAVDARRLEVRRQIAFLRRTDAFLEHLTQCVHPVIAECEGCSGYLDAVS